jgi:Zn-finger nucleic acid-binding protein
MKCPTDGATLTMSERGGIEIDYCPECRGVWLDRGELDKIIERSLLQNPSAPAPPPAPPAASAPGGYEQQRDQRREQHDQRYAQPAYGQPYRKKRKESWLSEIFD